MAVDFFKKFVDDLGDPDTAIAGNSSAEFTGYIDTGSYILNALLSGSLFGGLPNNKALVFAGDPATGKTFFALGIIKHFLESDPKARVFYFDTEAAVTRQMLMDRGIDPNRVAVSEPVSIEAFRHKAYTLLEKYLEIPKEQRFPALLVLDSLGAMSSNKELSDVGEGNDTRDMTKAPLLKGTFRVLRLKLATAQIPLIITNHVYAVIGAYMPTKEMAGGSGAKYAADTIVTLTKSKEKDADKNVIGSVVTATATKSRLTKENTKVRTRIMYDGGLDKYYGLLELSVAAGVVKKGTKYEFPDGTKAFEKSINKAPEKFFTKDVLDKLEAYVAQKFKYTGAPDEVEEEGDDE